MDRGSSHSRAEGRRFALAGCTLLLASAWVGAWWDEYTRGGWSTWLSICQAGSRRFATVLYLYAALLPSSLIAMLVAGLGVVGLAALARRRSALALGGIAGHAGCIAAMPVTIYLCANLFDDPRNAGLQLASMLLLDGAIAFTLALALIRALQPPVPDCCRDRAGLD